MNPPVKFGPDFLRRLEDLHARASAWVSRREGIGPGWLAGSGQEFAGHRPYRPGEELRHLDWNLLARSDQAFVRVMRREAGERWVVAVDGSASMGVGGMVGGSGRSASKLQLASECALGFTSIALRRGAAVSLCVSGDVGASFQARGPWDLRRSLAFLEGRQAAGSLGIGSLGGRPEHENAERALLLGDLFDLRPADLVGWVRSGRALSAAQILATDELDPPRRGWIQWLDPETGERVGTELDPKTCERYDEQIKSRLESWRSICARHRIAYGMWTTRACFEDVVLGILAR